MPPKKRPGLGKGLDALIPPSETPPLAAWVEPATGVAQISVTAIRPNPRQPRTLFDPEELRDLAASIREHGIIQPVILTPSEQPGQYSLIAGQRRWMAAQQAGLERIPAIVRASDEQERLELALIENVQRANLSALETAEAYRQLNDEFGLSHEEIAQRVGKSRVAVTNTLRLLNLPPSVLTALRQSQISEGHARALLALPTPQAQAAALQTVIEKALNVRQTEELARKLSGDKPPQRAKAAPTPEISALEARLRTSLGTKVSLKHGRKGGTITIHYYSNEELETLIEQLGGEG